MTSSDFVRITETATADGYRIVRYRHTAASVFTAIVTKQVLDDYDEIYEPGGRLIQYRIYREVSANHRAGGG